MSKRNYLGACTIGAVVAAFALACADTPTAVVDDRLVPGDALFGVTSTPNAQDWRQCRNNNDRDSECDWINGNLNAQHNTYFEGDMVPKALRIPNIVGGDPFTVVMSYGVSKGGKTTHDFLGKWNLDIVNANPCQGAGGGGGRYAAFCDGTALGDLRTITTISNTMDGLSTSALNAACGAHPGFADAQAAMAQAIGAVGAGNLIIEAIDFDDVEVTNITWSGCPFTGDVEAELTMTVTPSPGVTEGLLLFGAHVARGFDWPNGGAGDVSGSPYHLGLKSVDGKSAGSMDLQMAAAAIVIPGSITVEKVCVGSTEGTFDYTGTVPGGGALAPFDLDCGESLQVVEGTDFGQYTITEDVPTGWELTDIECTAGSTSLATATATVNLAEGQHVHCTFENTRQGSITIVKNTIGGDGTFGYTASGGAPLANFSITTVANTGNEVFNNVSPGAYTVTEDGPPAGWEFVSLVCVGNGPAGTVVGQTANIDLEAGGSVTCTYTNQELGTITIVKNTIGGDDTFDYTASGGAPLANFSITTVGGTGQEVFNNVSPGAYTVTEDGPGGSWVFVSLVCVGNGPGGSVVGQTANIDLEAGGSVTCTYTNELIVEAEDETAWASNTLDCCTLQFAPDRGWATYVVYQGFEGTGKVVGFFAGQTIHVGRVEFSAVSGGNVTIEITLEGGWSFQAGSVVAVQGYATAPSGNPAPGQFDHKEPAAGTTHTIIVPVANFFAVHAVVE